MAEVVTPRDLDPVTTVPDNAEFEVHKDGFLVNNKMTKASIKDDFGINANTAYKDRVKTKVLWAGPLSVVGVPTSLDAGEKFSDWDILDVDFGLSSDTNLTVVMSSQLMLISGRSELRLYSDSGFMTFKKLSDTTFEISGKTVIAGNIQRIIGIKL